ncbi:hypothetical protein AYO22_01546 [Fonsecaea multimorphosa]|nr:hypothetical protein AYO22_01546 [Fonsecaea multimorphosa]
MFRGHAKQPPKKAGRRKKETVPEIEDPELNIFLQLENTARTVGVELDPCLRPSAASSLGNRKPEMKPIDESSDADFNILQSQDAEAHKKRKTKALAFATAQDGEDAGLLTAIIHIDDNPGLILDEATRMVEELEATAIMENVEDAQIKELRRLLDFLEGNFFSDGWDDDESEGDEEAET